MNSLQTGRSAALLGRQALITGASRGLGRAIAVAMWQAGADLLLVARSESTLLQLQSELLRSRCREDQQVYVFWSDLQSADSVPAIVQAVQCVWNGLDVLVNNAAILGPIGRVWENDWEAWQQSIRVNLLAPVELCRAFVPSMISRGGGKVINLSGGGATAPRPNFSAYATAKAGLVRFSEGLAAEVRDANIQVNCVAPGALNTALNQAVLGAGPERAGADEYARAVALADQENVTPCRAADLVVFLASPASDCITGRLLSAVWDPWDRLAGHVDELNGSDIYTLRRIVPTDRGKVW